MSNLKHPEESLTHPALKGQARRMVDLYIGGLRVETIFAQCEVPYTTHTRKMFDQARRALGHPKRRKVGAVNPMWGGAKPRYRKGYRYIVVPGTFDRKGHTRYRPEHHLVMESTLGRPLLKTEVVHHVDGDTLNNAPENLRVYQSNGEHLAAELRGKCPNWSEDGRRVLAAKAQSRRGKPFGLSDSALREMSRHSQA